MDRRRRGVAPPDQYEVAAKALKVGVLVSRLMRSGAAEEDRRMPEAAMSLLRTLHAAGSMPVAEVKAAPMRAHVPVQSVLDQVIQAGLVTIERGSSAGDGAALVALTDAGREVYAARQALLAAPLAEMLQNLKEEDRHLVRDAIALLERLSATGAAQEITAIP